MLIKVRKCFLKVSLRHRNRNCNKGKIQKCTMILYLKENAKLEASMSPENIMCSLLEKNRDFSR